jgi:hypothetical protein
VKQILLVLRKDCRKFWPEILLTLAITAAFVWLSPYLWRNPSPAAPHWFTLDWQRLQILANLVEALVPVTWLILIARVVHEENLVGNRQFWLTRPYTWQALLAEKLLFVMLFVGVPFTVSQICLLLGAGFSPMAYLPNLAVALLLMAGFVVVPMIAIASVTRTLLRIIGSLLTVVIALAAVDFLGADFRFAPAVSIPYSDRITIPIILIFCATVLVAQYSARKLWLSRTLLVILGITVVGLAMQPFAVSLLERIYQLPYPGHTNPIVVRQDTSSKEGITALTWNGRTVNLNIPIEATQIPPDGQVTPDDIRITIDSANGTHWTSPWQAIENHRLSNEAPRDILSVDIDRATFDRLRTSPVTLHVGIAFTQLAQGDSSTLAFDPQRDLFLPHVGICTYDGSAAFLRNDLSCRVALHSPPLTRITIARSPFPCTREGTQPGVEPDSTWIEGSIHPDAASLDLSPVRTMDIILPSYQPVSAHEESSTKLALCPGAPITVTSFRLVRRFQYQLDLPAVTMPLVSTFVTRK